MQSKISAFLAVFLFPLLSLAQTVSNSLYTDADLNAKTIDQSKPVGVIDGAASVTLTGAATYTIPIKCPPGTNGMTPSIALTYNSQAGSDGLGIGWSISGLSTITRVSKDVYHDGGVSPVGFVDADAYALDGNRLIHIGGNYGQSGSTYKLENDNFSTVTLFDNGTNQWFKVLTKDGTIMEYGSSSNGRFLNDDASEVMIWRLNRIEDLNTNFIVFSYTSWSGTGGSRTTLLDKVAYTGNVLASQAPYNELKFNYIESPQTNIQYEGGSSILSKTLLSSINVSCDGTLLKSYGFNYGHDNIRPFLKEVSEKNAANVQLNSTVFKYGDQPSASAVTQSNLPVPYLSSPYTGDVDLISGDYNGDGLTDIVAASYTISGSSRYHTNYTLYKNIGSDQYQQQGQPIPLSNTQILGNFSGYFGILPADFNGDGNNDIWAYEQGAGSSQSFKIFYGHSLSMLQPIPFQVTPLVTWGGQNTGGFVTSFADHESFFPGDFNGDRKSDMFVLSCGASNNQHFPFIYEDGTIGKSVTGILFSLLNTHDFNVSVIDFDGDGKSELLFTGDLNYFVYTFSKLSNGHYLAQLMTSGTNIPSYWNVIYPGDFNGDGKTDLLYRAGDYSYWKLAISNGKQF